MLSSPVYEKCRGAHIFMHSLSMRCHTHMQAMRLYEALCAARQRYYVEPRREARGWRVSPVTATEQQVCSD